LALRSRACVWRIPRYFGTGEQIIGGNDLFIAAHALHVDATLETNNIEKFERTPTLSLENLV